MFDSFSAAANGGSTLAVTSLTICALPNKRDVVKCGKLKRWAELINRHSLSCIISIILKCERLISKI